VSVHIDPAALRDILVRVGVAAPDAGLQPALREVCLAAVELFMVDGAGILIGDDDGILRDVTASDEGGKVLERAQEITGEGPCVDAIEADAVVQTSDVLTDDRWPLLAGELAGARVRAVLGIPIHAGPTAIGSLNVYRADVYAWDESDVDALQAFSGVVDQWLGAALLAESREAVIEQLRHALESRVVIERAVGVLMSEQRVPAASAFEQLRGRARAERRKVAHLAAEILADVGGDAGSPATEAIAPS
jgi:GAF domain-containing protein